MKQMETVIKLLCRYEKYGKYRSTSHGDSYNHHDKYGFGGDEHDDHHDHHDGGFR